MRRCKDLCFNPDKELPGFETFCEDYPAYRQLIPVHPGGQVLKIEVEPRIMTMLTSFLKNPMLAETPMYHAICRCDADALQGKIIFPNLVPLTDTLLLSLYFTELIDLLPEDIINLHDISLNSWTAVHYAVHVGNVDCLRVLISSPKVLANAKDAYGDTAVDLAIRGRKEEIYEVFWQCSIDEQNPYEIPPPLEWEVLGWEQFWYPPSSPSGEDEEEIAQLMDEVQLSQGSNISEVEDFQDEDADPFQGKILFLLLSF